MLELQLKTANYKDFLQHLSEKLQTKLSENRIILPESFGKGYMQMVELPNGLQSLVSDISYHIDVMYKREKMDQYFCILHFNDVELSGSIQFVKNGAATEDKSIRRAGVTLTSSYNDFSFVVKAKTKAKSVNILLPQEWMQNNLSAYNELRTLSQFTSFGNTVTHPEPFDIQNRIMFDEVFHTGTDHPLQIMIIKNRIMLLLEHFLLRLYRNMKTAVEGTHRKIKASDLSKLMEIESLLVRDLRQQPPTIVNLAERTGMSVSKLKATFKKVYGTGIYEYYQKNRMLKARSLLVTGQYTVKEVGLQLGYTNLSNFSLAFRKEFGILPSHV